MQWDGLLEHLWSIGCRCRVFCLFKSYLSDRYIMVVTSLDSSDLRPISAGIPQGAIWSPLLFIFIFACFQKQRNTVWWLVIQMRVKYTGILYNTKHRTVVCYTTWCTSIACDCHT